MGGLAFVLNSSVIQYSNWPVADGYITSLNVPANPSAIPKTGTPYSGHGMPFLHRVVNTLFHHIIILARVIQTYVLNSLFARKGFPQYETIKSEAERIFYAGRSELLFEVVRPINNRVKHFGGVSKMNPSDYVTLLPGTSSKRTGPVSCRAPTTGFRYLNSSLSSAIWNNSTTLPLTFINCICSSESAVMKPLAIRRPHLYEGLVAEDVKKRFNAISNEFPQLNWSSLTTEPFILVSFGSVAQAQYMPVELAQKFFEAFSQSPFTIIWQTNSAFESLLWARNVTVPKNVRLSSWVPVKHILAHPNLQYLISHGGINTINELLLFGVPMLGGDQVSNLQRLVDLGAAAKMSIKDIAQGELLTNMRRFERNLDRYWNRMQQLRKMLESHHELHSDIQDFWIGWTVRNGKRLRGRSFFRLDYIGHTENAFWISLALSFVSLSVILY
ncbi:Glycosyltransferase family 28 protein [Trichostrongylus colubriformis]|uniref:glucuronosyltransferase n=1 Tax=Trichostrongylus colubriformis TaxID=6319 RepID=A0AAN8IGZ7_TRICO